MPWMMTRKCACCGAEFKAREADVKRGWGLFCNKRCKAVYQERKTGQYKKIKDSFEPPFFDEDDDFDPSWDAHKDY